MKEILEKTTTEVLRGYYYDLRGCYPPECFEREQLIEILLKSFN